jgi:hypothetical protein
MHPPVVQPPLFFVNVASKGLNDYVSPLDATHTRWFESVASKRLWSLHNYGSGVPYFCAKPGLKDALRGDDETDGKAAAGCRTPNKKRQPRLPLL